MFDKRHNQKIARIVRDEEGIELTPDQIDEQRKEAFATIRTKMRERGYDMPDDDEELLRLLYRMHYK